jgi:hypothetical protein
MKLLRDLFCESDNATWDLGRIMSAGVVLTFLGLAISAYGFKNEHFDPQAFGIGIGSALAAFGAAIMLKDREK